MAEQEKPYALLNCPLRFNPFQYDPCELWKAQGDNKRIYIADEVGLGKTIEAGIIIKEELVKNINHGKFLIVAPRFLCEQWKDQLYDLFNIKSVIFPSKKNNEEMFDVIILPLSRLNSYVETKVNSLEINTIIVDEAHYFRNGSGTARYNNLAIIIKKISNRIFMSATPVNNYSTDWINQIKLLEPKEENDYLTQNKKSEAFPYCKIREINTIYCFLSEAEQKFYDTTDEVSDTEFGKTIFRHIGASSLYALDECYKNNGFDEFELEMIKESYLEEMDKASTDIGEINLEPEHSLEGEDSKAKQLYTTLKEKLVTQDNNKAVVFAHYLATCNYLVEYLNGKEGFSKEISSNEKIKIFSIKGKMNQIEQQSVAKQFKDYPGNAVLICSDVCKEGVNLQCANILVNYDLPFNPAIMEQRIGRVDRVGQAKDIYIYNFVVENTYDDTVYYQFILGKLNIIKDYSENVGINELNITSDYTIDKAIEKAYKSAEKQDNKNKQDDANKHVEASEGEIVKKLKTYLVKYILLGKKKTLQDVEEEEAKQQYKEKKEELQEKEINDNNLTDWIKEVKEAGKQLKKNIDVESFNNKLASFKDKYGEVEKEDIEITTTIEQIKKLFDDSENRRWLKAFINLDEEKGGFDVFKYLKDTQDIKGVKEKLVIKESPIKVSYAYLNPEINKSGTCEKDWDEYLENFVPYDMLNKLTERDLS